MKTTHAVTLAVLTGLTITPLTFGWGSYVETRCYYPAPVVVERVYTPPVISYEPRVVERTSCFGNDWFSIYSTRSSVVYEPVVEYPRVERTVVYERPPVVEHVYVAPRCETSVIIRPRVEHRQTYVVERERPNRKVVVIKKDRDHHRRVRIKIDD